MKKPPTKYYIGIDEVGRGPLAGPVTLGAFMVPNKKIKEFKKKMREIKGKDSKKLSEKEREGWHQFFYSERKAGNYNFVTVSISSKKIDEKGISWCIKKGITTSLSKLKINPDEADISLDGLLYAPDKFKKQKTIIKGDEKNDLIAAASIVAKVTRDRFMKRLANEFPEYGFEEHKGYGTKSHITAIKKHGKSYFHRESFCKNI